MPTLLYFFNTGEDSDYIPLNETVTFTTMETEKTISLTVRADRKIEDLEDFTVLVSPLNGPEYPFPVRVNPQEDRATVTIRDEEGE